MSVGIYRYGGNGSPLSHGIEMMGSKKKAEEAKEKTSGNVSANDLLVGTLRGDASDRALAAKEKGARNSLKTLLKQFSKDLETDAQIEGLKSEKQNLAEELGTYKEELDKRITKRNQLKENYQVDDHSEEEANLNLLRKQRDEPDGLTEEEQAKLANMGELTDYQKDALHLDDAIDYWSKLVDSTQDSLSNIGKTVDAIKLERLKSDPMVDAKKKAEELRKDGIEEAAGILVDEAVENIKETFGGEDDKDADKVDDKEKDDDKKADDKEETDKTANNTDNVTASDDKIGVALDMEEKQKQLLAKMKSFMQTQQALTEDFMGIQVDALL